MTDFAILLAGPLMSAAPLVARLAGVRVIAADGGMAHAAPLNLVPELWVGDFDSASPDLLKQWPQVPRAVWPVAKDATDGELAARIAIQRGARRLFFVGAIGGAADHALGLASLAIGLALEGYEIVMMDGCQTGYPLIPGACYLDTRAGDRFSIIPFMDLVGLDVAGARWPLAGATVKLGSTLSQSNEATGPVSLGLVSGYGLVVVTSCA